MGYSAVVRRFLAPRASGVLALCAVLSLSAPLSRAIAPDQFPTLRWGVELAAHWQWLYLGAGLVAFVLRWCVVRPQWWHSAPLIVLAACFGVRAPSLPSAAEPVPREAVLVLGTANLNLNTRDFGPLTTWLLSAQSPDVVFLQEFTPAAAAALERPLLAQRYPHRLQAPQSDPFGLAVLSRYPLGQTQVLQPPNGGETLALRAVLTLPGGRSVRLGALHPMPPLNAAYRQARDDALKATATDLTQDGALALMVGDLNTTPWAQSLWDVEHAMRSALGATATWPNWGGWLNLLPLDHVMASQGWTVLESGRGPDLGSDHRPLWVRLVAQ